MISYYICTAFLFFQLFECKSNNHALPDLKSSSQSILQRRAIVGSRETESRKQHRKHDNIAFKNKCLLI